MSQIDLDIGESFVLARLTNNLSQSARDFMIFEMAAGFECFAAIVGALDFDICALIQMITSQLIREAKLVEPEIMIIQKLRLALTNPFNSQLLTFFPSFYLICFSAF